MVTRLNSQGQNQFVTEINGIITDFNALKTGNQLFGGDSLTMQLVVSGNTLDINTSVAAYATATWRIVFVPSEMKNAFGELTYSYVPSGASGDETVSFVPDVATTSSTQLGWLFTYAGMDNTVTVNVLFAVKSPSTGSLTITKVS